jgi:predicted NAD/FAD-dependent oxidoreductase
VYNDFLFQDGKTEFFNAAVMTMPIPQILQLPGMDQILDKKTTEKLSNVQYSARYALALFFG